MKIETGETTFSSVTLTLETERELVALVVALGETSPLDERKELEKMGYSEDDARSMSEFTYELYSTLDDLFDGT